MAKSITLQDVQKVFTLGDVEHVAVDGISLEIPEGSFTTIVGPSGCGKTTTLRMLAGLETPTTGTISFGETDVTTMSPQERNVSMVFQSVALYPHMSVRDNIGYALKVAGVPKADRDPTIEEAAETLQITDQLEKMPSELSGGQQQRVALGSAFVQDPDVLLLDEPMSDLDAKLKAELRVEIQRLHQELDTTVVYVTHDQTEAMTMSDYVVLLRSGKIEQFDPPKTLFDRPNSEYVARFIGTPATNVLECTLETDNGDPTIVGHGLEKTISDAGLENRIGDTVKFGLRPQYVAPDDAGDLDVIVEVVEPLGVKSVVHCHTRDETPFDVVASGVDDLEPDDVLRISFDTRDAFLFDSTGKTIAFGDELAVLEQSQ